MVNNIQGRLECKPEPNAAGIPIGGYSHSCQGCSVEGARLRCTHCGTADGARVASEYELSRCQPPAKLDNNNGRLTCKGVPSASDIPEGKYSRSCEGCSVEGGRLTCSHCSAADGRQLFATFVVSGCSPPSYLDNQDGQLKCKGPDR